MKKIFSICFVAAAAMMISCGGNANKPAETQAVDTVKVEQKDSCCQAGDSTCCDKADSTVAAPAAAEVK